MSIQTRREAARKEVTSPITGEVFRIRKLSAYEVSLSRLNAVLGATGDMKPDEEPVGIRAAVAKDRMDFETQRKVLEFGVVSPVIFFGDEDKTPDEAMHVRWLGEDFAWLFAQVLNLSGLTEETVEKVNAFIKNENSPASSTPLAGDTGDVQASS